MFYVKLMSYCSKWEFGCHFCYSMLLATDKLMIPQWTDSNVLIYQWGSLSIVLFSMKYTLLTVFKTL